MRVQTINEIITKSLNETTMTGSGECYMTPYAFSKGGPNKRLTKLMKTMDMEYARNDQKVYKNLWNFKPPTKINESLEPADYNKIKSLIRGEVALLFYDLFKKRAVWVK